MSKILDSNYFIYIFFLVYLLTGILIFDDYPVTPDEELHRVNGLISLKYILNLFSINWFKFTEFTNVPDLYDDWRKSYGVLFDLPISFFQVMLKIDNQNIFLLRHFLNFIIFFIGVIYFYKLINENFSNKLALLGTLILITSPRIFSHSFYNSKDILFLSLIIIAVFYCIKLLKKNNIKNLILASLFCALATNIRIIALYLPILTFIFYIYFEETNLKKNIFKFLIIFFFSYFLFIYLIWPFLWAAPFKNFFLILKESTAYPNHWNFNILYLGKYLNPENIPWHYFFVWLTITTPPIFLLMIVFGVFVFLKNYLRFFFKIDFKKNISLWTDKNQMINLFIFLNFFIPIFFVICLNSTLYNGWRHLFFIYPFLIYLSLYGVSLIKKNLKFLRILISIIIIQLFSNIYIIYNSHPVQNTYFNIFAKKFVRGNMPIDYWGLGNKKTIEYVLKKNKNISISTSSFTPLHYLKLSKEKNNNFDKITYNGTDINSKSKSDFIFTNYYYDESPFNIAKYSIPNNYKSYYKLIINGIIVNEIFTK